MLRCTRAERRTTFAVDHCCLRPAEERAARRLSQSTHRQVRAAGEAWGSYVAAAKRLVEVDRALP